MSLLKPFKVDSSSAGQARIYPRGVALPRKARLDLILLQMIGERAEGQCGVCEQPLLRSWKYCPSCGTAIDWSP